MKSVAFLQNQWFKNPDRVREIYARHAGDMDRRAKLNAAYLFFGSLTGRRLASAFGPEGRHGIIWEECSPLVGGVSSSCFPADLEHMKQVIDFHQPDVILAFGKLASDAIVNVWDGKLICGPHPAARGSCVMQELKRMADELRVKS